MFQPRLKNVFRSRWHTLWWAAAMCTTAYCSVPAAKHADPQPKPADTPHQTVQWWQKAPAKG